MFTHWYISTPVKYKNAWVYFNVGLKPMAFATDSRKKGCWYWYPVGVITWAGFEPVLGGPLILDRFFAGGQPRHISTRPVDWKTRPQIRLSKKNLKGKEPEKNQRFFPETRRFFEGFEVLIPGSFTILFFANIWNRPGSPILILSNTRHQRLVDGSKNRRNTDLNPQPILQSM